MTGGIGPKGQTRNPATTLILGLVCCFYAVYALWTMLVELGQFTRDDDFKPWMMFVPLLGIYFLLVKVPEQVTRAKQMAGSRNREASSVVLYFLVPAYALAKDLNEVWDPTSG
jgi:hypothetical protein